MSAPHININAGGARDVTEYAVINRRLLCQRAGAFESIQQDRVAQTNLDNLIEVFENRIKLCQEIKLFGKVVSYTARHNAAAQQPMASQLFIQAQQPFAQAKA